MKLRLNRDKIDQNVGVRCDVKDELGCVNVTNGSLLFESCFTVSLPKKNISQYHLYKILLASFITVASHRAREFSN
jgi:hypothetical protein